MISFIETLHCFVLRIFRDYASNLSRFSLEIKYHSIAVTTLDENLIANRENHFQLTGISRFPSSHQISPFDELKLMRTQTFRLAFDFVT